MAEKQALSPEMIEEITRAAVQAAMEFQVKAK